MDLVAGCICGLPEDLKLAEGHNLPQVYLQPFRRIRSQAVVRPTGPHIAVDCILRIVACPGLCTAGGHSLIQRQIRAVGRLFTGFAWIRFFTNAPNFHFKQRDRSPIDVGFSSSVGGIPVNIDAEIACRFGVFKQDGLLQLGNAGVRGIDRFPIRCIIRNLQAVAVDVQAFPFKNCLIKRFFFAEIELEPAGLLRIGFVRSPAGLIGFWRRIAVYDSIDRLIGGQGGVWLDAGSSYCCTAGKVAKAAELRLLKSRVNAKSMDSSLLPFFFIRTSPSFQTVFIRASHLKDL